MNRHVQYTASRSLQTGFTLVELMITMVILGILAAIAIPQYRNHIITGKIPIATAGLQSTQVAMEQFFQDKQTYVGSTTPCSSANNATSNQYFNFTCGPTAPTATTYTLTATGQGTMSAFSYTLDQAGNKATTIGTGAPSGWKVHSPNTCWVTGAGGKC
jgi:type IV pilus assembly protein PilE